MRVEQAGPPSGNRLTPDSTSRAVSDLRGSAGGRIWRLPESELWVTGRHDGHVRLHWQLSHRPYDEARWKFATTARHVAGEAMRRVADAFGLLFDS
ncbi:DUF6228 family protein [Promicromonospora sukumoe]|uniref:DUF6228 family protein n=1 Tax=Promicromonospora sukumoe TaxID=88382 RepID=UPI0036532919